MSDNINKNQTEIIIEKKQANNERRIDQSAEKQIEDNKEIGKENKNSAVNNKKGKRKRKFPGIWELIRLAVMGVALMTVSVAAYQITNDYLEYEEGDSAYDEIAAMMYEMPQYSDDGSNLMYEADEVGIAGAQIKGNSDPIFVWNQEKFEKMLEFNKDTKGWIRLKGKKNQQDEISYPIVQGPDNEYYLHYLANRTWNANGSIFIDYQLEKGLKSRNCIIYGHNMNNGAMFGKLKNYLSEDYYKEHPYFDIYIEEKHYRYYVFSIYKTETVGSESYMMEFTEEETEEETTDAKNKDKKDSKDTDKKDKKAADTKAAENNKQETSVKKNTKKNKQTKKEPETTTISPEEAKRLEREEKKRLREEENQRFIEWCHKMASQSYIKIKAPYYKGFKDFDKNSKIITLVTCTPTDASRKQVVQLVRGEEIITDAKGKEKVK